MMSQLPAVTRLIMRLESLCFQSVHQVKREKLHASKCLRVFRVRKNINHEKHTRFTYLRIIKVTTILTAMVTLLSSKRRSRILSTVN